MQTIILDDEKPAITILTAFVKRVPFLNLQLTTSNAFEALEVLNQQQTDLLLLDIEMPDITGIELLNSIEKPPMVIFTTAYEQYALKGYELDAIDYLLKPIRFDRFLKGVNKAQKVFQTETKDKLKEDFLLVKVDYKTKKIPHENILFIEGLKDYVKIMTVDGMILTRLNMKGIQEKLPSNEFIRIHRSYIVSFSKIDSFQKSKVSIGGKELPIGETYSKQLLQRLK